MPPYGRPSPVPSYWTRVQSTRYWGRTHVRPQGAEGVWNEGFAREHAGQEERSAPGNAACLAERVVVTGQRSGR